MRQELRAGPDETALPLRLGRANRASSVAFFLGGSLFALGAYLAQTGDRDLETVNVTYLVGGVFFSLGAAALVLLVHLTPAGREADSPAHRTAWASAVVLLLGTLLFAVSLVAAFAEGLTPRQSNGWIWLPDFLGCVCFLASGHLGLRALRAHPWRQRTRELGWWVAGVNQIGSVLFLLAGLAAFTRPATSTVVDAALVNWGTFAGAALFAIGGVLQMFDTPAHPSERPDR